MVLGLETVLEELFVSGEAKLTPEWSDIRTQVSATAHSNGKVMIEDMSKRMVSSLQ